MLNLLTVVVLSYLVGSIPTGIIAGRLIRGIDLREHGSGNTGATNTFRVLGWKIGLPVAVIDMLKGFVSVAFITRVVFFDGPVYPPSVLFIGATLCSVLGHVKPVFARFRGGRGFGTAVGAVTAQAPLVFPICLFVFFLVLALTGYVSVCAVAAAFALPPAYLYTTRVTSTAFDPVVFGFFVFAFFLTLFGVRKKLRLYLRGEAELFHKVMILRRRKGA